MMISRDAQGTTARHLNETPQESAGGRPVAMFAKHGVEELTVTIDRPVQVAPAPGDFHIGLVDVPRPARPPAAARPKIGTDQWREAELLGADRLVADGVATLEQEFRYVPQPKLVAQVLEHGEQHDISRELKLVERRAGALVEASLAASARGPAVAKRRP